jgi:hypothetical protein
MKSFPSKLTPDNLNNFYKYNINRQTCYLRRAIYEWMLTDNFTKPETKDQNGNTIYPERCFDLQGLSQSKNIIYSDDSIQTICKELNDLGWLTKVAFSNSALYIYKKDERNPCRWDYEELDL